MVYDFQIHKIDNNIAQGFIVVGRKPEKDDFWNQTGEVEFGGGYQETGSWDLQGYEDAKDVYRQRNLVRTVELPEDKEFLIGHCLRVKFESYSSGTGKFLRFSTMSMFSMSTKTPKVYDLFNKEVKL